MYHVLWTLLLTCLLCLEAKGMDYLAPPLTPLFELYPDYCEALNTPQVLNTVFTYENNEEAPTLEQVQIYARKLTREQRKCPCGFTGRSKEQLKKHVSNDHIIKSTNNKNKIRYACPTCKKTTLYRSELLTHLFMHPLDGPFRCLVPSCGHRRSNPMFLVPHFKDKHMQ